MKTSETDLTVNKYLAELKTVYENFPTPQVINCALAILRLSGKGNLYVIGNGGSASTASHMAIDLGVGSLRRQNPVRCISLVENAGVLTATSNDLDFNSVFSQQIELLAQPGDMLICFSASGNSRNLIEAVLAAKKLGVSTVGVTGFDGGKLKEICDLSIHIPTKLGSYGVVEDAHSSVSHILTEIIRNA
jgi:D-sedoheptulose 7-phosphate isomerase